jgi:hypothetical protein
MAINTLFKNRIRTKLFLLICFLSFSNLAIGFNPIDPGKEIKKIKISVKHNSEGAPLTFGIPFAKGELYLPENIRILDAKGNVIPSQITEVNTWEPADKSIQWVWVFIFSNGSDDYTLEYGTGVRNNSNNGDGIKVSNHWVEGGRIRVNTGKMDFSLRKGIGGFIDEVRLSSDNKGSKDGDMIAKSPENGRGNFVDILDDSTLDPSKAEITFVRLDKGSGPMHVILHIEGIYHYDKKNEAPFETHIHVYKDKSYIRVLNTIVYTGVPTKHPLLEGQHAMMAISDKNIINEDSVANAKDKRWTEPGDQIAQMGLNLSYNLSYPLTFKTSYREGEWWESGIRKNYSTTIEKNQHVSILQTGPNPKSIPPLETSSLTKRLEKGNFIATINKDKKKEIERSKLDGWIDISDKKWGIAIGIRNFFQEYPKEISLDSKNDLLHIYSWSPNVKPMGFERYSDSIIDGDEFDDFAQGVAKTTENVFYFHEANKTTEDVKKVLDYFLDPPVAHADPQTYAKSKVFGDIAAESTSNPAFERGLKYKFEWMLYNQKWEPWYGIWDFGDMKNYFYKGEWHQWSGNEPGQDFMWWLEFIRTGDRDMYLQGQAMSRIGMDVNNVHWPKDPVFEGDSNSALDYWEFLKKPKGSPYVGMGRRHAGQHWISQLSAHVWVPGWITSYFLTGEQRGLEVSKLTGDLYLKRIWGEHGLTGRRLYLSVWNLDWIFNATKDSRYGDELDYRVNRMMAAQKEQQGNLVRDRYDYAQFYASHGFEQYLNFTNRNPEKIKASIIENARRLRDVPPWGHEYESYLATIHPILLGYKYTGDKSFLNVAKSRAEILKMDKLPQPVSDYKTQQDLENALESVSKLPKKTEPYEWIENGLDTKAEKNDKSGIPIWKYTSGLRIFAWTHIYSVPWLLFSIENEGKVQELKIKN